MSAAELLLTTELARLESEDVKGVTVPSPASRDVDGSAPGAFLLRGFGAGSEFAE